MIGDDVLDHLPIRDEYLAPFVRDEPRVCESDLVDRARMRLAAWDLDADPVVEAKRLGPHEHDARTEISQGAREGYPQDQREYSARREQRPGRRSGFREEREHAPGGDEDEEQGDEPRNKGDAGATPRGPPVVGGFGKVLFVSIQGQAQRDTRTDDHDDPHRHEGDRPNGVAREAHGYHGEAATPARSRVSVASQHIDELVIVMSERPSFRVRRAPPCDAAIVRVGGRPQGPAGRASWPYRISVAVVGNQRGARGGRDHPRSSAESRDRRGAGVMPSRPERPL